ncbi:MAG: acyl-CoA dehydrogenase family protein [Candidatus Krumholzibacteria bacterium]|jgi:alkylation response protein AidB-like acyl-CoA dehydrogenase|nr:acyl-CoA dehydrogenase family protein [Candidatus Krumholzibacteria bacterium]MDP6669319.1 acyl-CoA dehydrogenase family protein [Candidatus Krumholzibacteria bacterium]MDP7021000.1 acyl-CoA dehydrogenase family protein [Candidatus Krumholzibacteria bacterium]
MDFRLSEEQRILRDMVRDFARKEIEEAASRNDREKTFPREILQKAASLGLMGVSVPAEYGGAGMDPLSYVLAIEEIAKACASTAVTLSVHNSLACGTLLKYGSEQLKQEWLPSAARGEVLGCYMLTEPEAGSDAASLSCRADACEGGWTVNGSKAFVTNGGESAFGILYARTDRDSRSRGISAFLVDFSSEGLVCGPEEKKMGLNASSTIMVSLEDVFLPASCLLGEVNRGYGIALEMLNGGRIGIGAQALGLASEALRLALAYSREREQFGKPIVENQSIQEHLTEMSLLVQQSRWMVYRAAQDYQDIIFAAASAKLAASKAAVRCAELAVQIHGGYGYTKDYKVERIFRDARVTEIYEGTSEVQRLVMIRQMLSEKEGVS